VEAVAEAAERAAGERAKVADGVEESRGPRTQDAQQAADARLDDRHLSVRERGRDPARDLAVLVGLVAADEEDGVRRDGLGAVGAVDAFEVLGEQGHTEY